MRERPKAVMVRLLKEEARLEVAKGQCAQCVVEMSVDVKSYSEPLRSRMK
jgi:hypothetical protein